jgi:organic radical activating enzyme
MPRHTDESPEAYQERILDPISPTYCAAKWLNATIMLGSGMTKSCHHPPEHKIPVKEIEIDFRALHNTSHKREQRRQMLDGTRPSECSYCWRVEDSGAVSDRVFYTSTYKDRDINATAKMPWDNIVAPQFLEISFDRICNFACSYCNSTFSTTWGNDIKRTGDYQQLKTDNATQAYSGDGTWAEPYGKLNIDNPHLEAFWKWWPELSQSLKQLRITGGEPTMSPHFWKLTEMIAKDGISDNLQFAVNTNLGIKDDLVTKLIDVSHTMKRFVLFTSCESYGAQAEYIRDGLNYQSWKTNYRRMIEEGNVERITCMMAVNGLCLDSITDLWDDLIDIKTQYGPDYSILSVNMVHYPSFMSPLMLPVHIRDQYREKISTWLKKYDGNPLLCDTEVYNIKKLITYLEHGEELVIDQDRESHENDFYHFYRQYDQRRGKNFQQTFAGPLQEWFVKLEKTYG